MMVMMDDAEIDGAESEAFPKIAHTTTSAIVQSWPIVTLLWYEGKFFIANLKS